MVHNLCSVHTQHSDEVLAQALSCLSMMEGGVGITISDGFMLASLFPIRRLGLDILFQSLLCFSLDLKFLIEQVSHLFVIIEQLDYEMTIMD